MTPRKLLLSSAISALVLAVPIAGEVPTMSPAEAAVHVGVSISFGTFYDRLAPYGSWVSYHSRYVFVPTGIAVGWRPYSRGHWVYTRRYGWLWVSDEPFGWATFHYGRWGYDNDIGWYWLPGYRWAPAWVAWRRSDTYVGWAPLPVSTLGSVHVSIGRVPATYWNVVKAPAILSVHVGNHILRDSDRTHVIIRRTRPLGGVRIVNKTVVNNVIKVKFVEKTTKKKVIVHQVAAADNPGKAGKASGNKVDVYAPHVKKTKAGEKPKHVKRLAQVRTHHKNADKQQAGESKAQTNQQAKKTAKKKGQQASHAGNKKHVQQHAGEATKKKHVRQHASEVTKKKHAQQHRSEAVEKKHVRQHANQAARRKLHAQQHSASTIGKTHKKKSFND